MIIIDIVTNIRWQCKASYNNHFIAVYIHKIEVMRVTQQHKGQNILGYNSSCNILRVYKGLQ